MNLYIEFFTLISSAITTLGNYINLRFIYLLHRSLGKRGHQFENIIAACIKSRNQVIENEALPQQKKRFLME